MKGPTRPNHALHPIAEKYAQVKGLKERGEGAIGYNPKTGELNKLKPGQKPPEPTIISPFSSDDEDDVDYPYGRQLGGSHA